MDKRRFDFLMFQATHNGVTPHKFERMQKEGKKIDPTQSAMVMIAPTELLELLQNQPVPEKAS